MTTAPTSPFITTPVDSLPAGPSHLDAARAYFKPTPAPLPFRSPSADAPRPGAAALPAAPASVSSSVPAASMGSAPAAAVPLAAPASSVSPAHFAAESPAPVSDAASASTPLVSAPAAAGTTPADIAEGLQPPPEHTRSHVGWQELKRKGNEALARAAALQQELDALRAQPPGGPADEATRARLAELETQNQAYSERLRALDLRSHPEFVEKFTAPQTQARAALAAIAREDEVPIDLDRLLALKGRAFNAHVSDTLGALTPHARVKFQAALDRYLAASQGADAALASADTFLQAAKQTTGARSRAAFDDVAASYRDHYVPMPVDPAAPEADRAAAQAYNTAVAEIARTAERYAFGEFNERTAADVAHKAALYEFTVARGLPRLGGMMKTALTERDAKIATLETQLKALTAARPQVAGGSGPTSDAPMASESHLTAARRYFGQAAG